MHTKQSRVISLHRQIERIQRCLAVLQRISDRYAWARLAIFVIGAVLSFAALATSGAALFWVIAGATAIIFSVIVHFHHRLQHSMARLRLWSELKRTHIARIQLDWPHILRRFARWHAANQPQDHPFSADLNLTGDRSITHLIDLAQTRAGSQRLYDWLLACEPDIKQIAERQEVVRELTPMAHFRERLYLISALASAESRADRDGMQIERWLDRLPPAQSLLPRLRLLSILAAINVVLFALNALGIIPALWQVSGLVYLVVQVYTLRNLGDLFEDATALADELEQLRSVSVFLEAYPVQSRPNLARLLMPFKDTRVYPSQRIRRLLRIVVGTSLRGNMLVWLALNLIVPWDVYFAHRLNELKADLADHLPIWLNAWFDLEALVSLATFAYLNPDYTLPNIAADGMQAAQPVFQAVGIGHPLLPFDNKVANDFSIAQAGEVVIVTGSNMSGKSSFLRTVGVNLCLAFAGGPVNAKSLQTPPFRLVTCIQVSDSVTDGISYFYAEVKRLKALLNALEQENPLPLFFLIDEIFRGTNNLERLIGSRSYLKALVGKNGTGIISTHDLELVKLANEIPAIHNYHFEDLIQDRRMAFDYKLRPGPSPSTNALKIMRLEGLPVEGAES